MSSFFTAVAVSSHPGSNSSIVSQPPALRIAQTLDSEGSIGALGALTGVQLGSDVPVRGVALPGL